MLTVRHGRPSLRALPFVLRPLVADDVFQVILCALAVGLVSRIRLVHAGVGKD